VDLLQLFQREIALQATFALDAIERFHAAVERYDEQFRFVPGKWGSNDEAIRRAHTDIWSAAQSFLVAAGNVSKCLWGINLDDGARAERRALRISLGVSESSPLKSRSLRNQYEHFDERLAEWHAETSGNISLIDLSVASPFPAAADVALRNFAPERSALTFRGTEYELQPLIDELQRVREAGIRESGLEF
jgi:hypothetical protein